MARISKDQFRDWSDKEKVNASDYVSERELLRVALNDNQEQIDDIKTSTLSIKESEEIRKVTQITAQGLTNVQSQFNDLSGEVGAVSNRFGEVLNEATQAKESVEAVKDSIQVNANEIMETKEELDVESNIGASVKSIWEPPIMPDTLRGNGLVPTSYDPDVQLNALMDPLVDGKYVTKRSIGMDQSGTFNQWCYEFTPRNPEKTILLTGMIHGNEYTAFYWMAQFLDLLVNKWQEYPQLAYLRKNVKIVTVPIANPWGHMNNSRYNVNGVDCSRNFSYNWGTSFDEYPQGSAPFSEAESVNIAALMAEIAPETVASLDFHTTLSEGDTHHILYYPRFLNNGIMSYLGLLDELQKPGETTAVASTSLPTLTNYAIYKHGFNGANPELKNGLAGATRSSEEMTRAMRFFGNFVLRAAQIESKNKGTTVDMGRIASIKYDHTVAGTLDFTTATYTAQASKTAIKFKSKAEGLFEVDGHITLTATENCTIGILPQLYQVQSPDFDFASTSSDEFNAVIINMKAGEEKIVPFQAEIICHKSNTMASNNTNKRTQEIVFQLRTKISSGKGSIKFIKAKARMTPNISGDRFERYTLGPTTLQYPKTEGRIYEF